MYHAITGGVPPTTIDRVLKDAYRPLAELKPEGYSPEILAGIDAGMTMLASDRPQSIAEWRRVLRTGEHHPSSQEVTQVEDKTVRFTRAASRGRKVRVTLGRRTLWGAAAAAAIVLAGGVYLAFTANQPSPTPTA